MNKIVKIIIEKAVVYEKIDLIPQVDEHWIKFCLIPLQRAWRERDRSNTSICGLCSGTTSYCKGCISDLYSD